SPASAPSEMPPAAGSASAGAAAPKVAPVCRSRLPSASAWPPATSHRLGREKPSSESTPARDNSSHATATAAGTMAPSSPPPRIISISVRQVLVQAVPVLQEARVLAGDEL